MASLGRGDLSEEVWPHLQHAAIAHVESDIEDDREADIGDPAVFLQHLRDQSGYLSGFGGKAPGLALRVADLLEAVKREAEADLLEGRLVEVAAACAVRN